MLSHDKPQNTQCWVKEARSKRVHIVRFHLEELSRSGKCTEAEADQCCLGPRVGMGVDY